MLFDIRAKILLKELSGSAATPSKENFPLRKVKRSNNVGMLSNAQLKELLQKTQNFTIETEDDGLRKARDLQESSKENHGQERDYLD